MLRSTDRGRRTALALLLAYMVPVAVQSQEGLSTSKADRAL
jgi:hypothetical protein